MKRRTAKKILSVGIDRLCRYTAGQIIEAGARIYGRGNNVELITVACVIAKQYKR